MLYLLRSFGRNKSILKVGYASDIDRRLNNYITYAPYTELINTKEGDFTDETMLHIYLHYLGFGKLGNEWYRDCQEVIDVFNSDLNDVLKEVWDKRDSIFSLIDLDQVCKAEVYRRALERYRPEDFIPVDRFSYDADSDKILRINKTGEAIDESYQLRLDQEILLNNQNLNQEVSSLYSEYSIDSNFERRMRLLCDFIDNNSEVYKSNIDTISVLMYRQVQFAESLSTSEIRAVSYREVNLKKIIEVQKTQDNRKSIIVGKFSVGSRYYLSSIKETLREAYAQLGISKSPKASDILEFLEVKKVTIIDPSTKEKINGYEILKVK